MVHANPRISEFGSIGLILDDLPEKGRLLSGILISKGYSANSLTYPQNGLDEIEKVCHRQIRLWRKRPDLLILDLNFSEPSILNILQKIRENNPSLPIFVCSNSVTEQFILDAAKLGASVFFPKADVEQMLDQMKKLSLGNKKERFANPSRTGEVRQPSDVSTEEGKVKQRKEVRKDGS